MTKFISGVAVLILLSSMSSKSSTQTEFIEVKTNTIVTPTIEQMERIIYLASIASSEMIPFDYDDAVCVIDVVENRERSTTKYKGDMHDIISGGAFDGYKTKRYLKVNKLAIEAAMNSVLKDESILDEDIYHFHNQITSTDKKHIKNIEDNYIRVRKNVHPTISKFQHSYFKKK